jgi:hypothetical protein
MPKTRRPCGVVVSQPSCSKTNSMAEGMELIERVHQLLEASGEPVVAPDHHGVYFSPSALREHPLKLWALFFRAAGKVGILGP